MDHLMAEKIIKTAKWDTPQQKIFKKQIDLA